MAERRVVDWLLTAGIVACAVLLAADQLDRSRRRAARERLVSEAGLLYEAMQRYFERHGAYPVPFGAEALEPGSLEPLKRRGYYAGRLPAGLADERLDAYGAPADNEFWLEMTATSAPPLRLVVARSDDAPLGGGVWLEGVYLYEDHRLHRR